MEQPLQRLSAGQILAVWEAGRPQHPLDRALTILAAASPGANRDALAELSIGERDELLLRLRTLVLGPGAEGFAECPQCRERIEFPFDTATFTLPSEGRTPGSARDGVHPITSRDLAAVAAAPDAATALRLLRERCAGGLPNESLESLSRAFLEADPLAEMLLQLTCPACAHEWALVFDIAEFFWKEISAHAQRLLAEIDALARAYGWTESEILNLPAKRRQTYLELVAA